MTPNVPVERRAAGTSGRHGQDAAGGTSARTPGSASASLCDLGEWDQNLDGLKRNGDGTIIRPLDQAKLFQARNIGMDVGVISLGRLCKSVDAAGTNAAQRVQEIQTRRSQLRKQ